MSIEANKKWRLGAAIALMAGWTTWLAAVPGPGTGHSFTSLASPFTQDLYATTGNLGGPFAILGGVAFTPDGRVWSAECSFLGTRLHRFASATTAVNGSSVHAEELVVDLTATGPLGFAAGGCGLVNHPDGSMYSSSRTGIWQLNATTGQPVAGPFGNGSNGLGIAVDPQAGHHLVYVGKDCHPSLDPTGTTCTLWDLDPVTHTSLVFARLTRAEFMLIDGLYFDPSGNFLFAAHRQVDIDDDTGVRSDHNSLQIIRRPAALLPVNAPIDDTQSLPVVPMVSEPDGVAFQAGSGFVVTLNESGDCLNATNHVVGSNPTTHLCAAGTTPIGGTMTRFDFAGADYTQVPTASTFAYGGFRGDLMQVGPDGCIYATQAPLSASGGTLGTRYDNDVTTSDNSLVQICGGGGFVPPPGVTHEATAPASVAGLVFLDANDNGVRDSGEGGVANVLVTLSTDPTHPLSSGGDGTFLFDQLAAGTYTVTTPATVTYGGGSIGHSTAISSGAFTLAAGEQKTGLEFGYAPGSIAGTVFQDLNYNTVRDSGEPPLGGVTVTLAGGAIGNASSNAMDGSYTFNLLASANYTVSVPGTAGALVLTTVGSRSVPLGIREHKTGVDFGYAPPISLACVTTTTGEVGVAYSASLAVTGGRSPFTYSIATGSLPAGLSLDASTGAITGTPTTAGPFSFTAQVVDANGATATTNGCGITIAPTALTIACVSPATGQVGVPYSGSAVASGGVAPYLYAVVGTLPAGLTLNATTGAISGTPTAAGSFSVKVTDSNAAGASTATSACSVTIVPAPLTIACVSPATGQVGVPYSGSAVASGGVAPYLYAVVGTLPAGLTLNATTGAISGTPTAVGSFSVKVTDSNAAGASTATSACSVTIVPAPLTIACVSPATGQVGVPYSGSAVASGGVAPYLYAVVGTLPAGLTLNATTGAISGTPTAAGSFSVKVTDSNAAGASTATSACSVTIAPAPPALSCVAAVTGQVGVAYSSSLVATGGVSPYLYSIVSGSLPTGLSLNASTGAITGTPTAAGPFAFTAKVVDARNNASGTTTSSSCGITIAPAPLTIACVSPATGQVGVPYSGSAVASGGVAPYLYAVVGTLPAGLTLNATTGAISGTPTAAGSFSVKVTDSNAAGASTATSACSVTIAPAPPALSCVAAVTGQVGVAYSSSLVATGGVSPYVYSIVSGSLPTGLSLNASTGAITGTPTAAGPFAFTAKVVDARNNASGTTTSSSCGITIAPAPLTIACVSPATGQVGVPYSGSAVASGGVAPYLYAVVGTLPAGLTLNATTGAISGTPTAAGSFSVKVTDSNAAGASTATSACSVTIAPAPPALSCVAAVTGQVGVAYSSSLVATGGVSPYTFSIVAGSLPTSLALNASTGAITGTPTAAGSFPFTAKVIDSRGTAAGTTTNSCGVTVAPVAQVPGLSITKSANTATYTSVGQVIVYTYVIRNIGNVNLTGPFTVTDDKLGVLPCTTATSLSPGASITCTANYVIKASDLGSVISLPSGVVANVDTGAWLQGVLSTQDTTISGAGPGVPNGIYPGWCIQDHVPTDLHNQPATLYSTIGGNLPADMAARHWNQINYALNHKIRGAGKSNLEFFKDVQTAIWVLNGEQDPEFGISATAQQMINEANAHPTFVPGPSDVVAVIVYSDGIAAQIRSGEIQESIIEMEPKASITNYAAGAGKLGTVTVTSNQVQVTVTQVISVLSPDVVSLTQSAASAAIASSGLTVGSMSSASSSIVPSGGVASQTPAAGTPVLSGSAVALVISSGAPAAGPAVDKMIFSDGTGKRTTAAFSTASPGEVLIAFATSDGPSSGGQTLTVAGAGLTWTLVRRSNTQLGSAEIWKATAVSTLTNVTVSSTQSAGGYHQSLSVVTFTRATGVGASAAAGAATGAPTVSLTTTRANSLVFGTGNDWDRAVARTVGPSQQMIHQWMDIGTGDTHWLQAGSAVISAAGTLFKLNDTAPASDHWNLTAVEIVP